MQEPRALLKQVGFTDKTKLFFKIAKEGLLLSKLRHRRDGWLDAFQAKQESLQMEEKIINEFDKDEWVW